MTASNSHVIRRRLTFVTEHTTARIVDILNRPKIEEAYRHVHFPTVAIEEVRQNQPEDEGNI